MMIAEYDANPVEPPSGSASHSDGVSTVTVAPGDTVVTACASALDDPPLTLVDKISTFTDEACAGAAATTDPAVAATAPAATSPAAASTGASAPATARRAALALPSLRTRAIRPPLMPGRACPASINSRWPRRSAVPDE